MEEAKPVYDSDFWHGRCCNKAKKMPFGSCVCAYQTTCPDHGTQCWGSHD